MKKVLLVILLLFSGCSSSVDKTDDTNSIFARYGIDSEQYIKLVEMDYDTFLNLESNSNLDGIFIITRSDCEYCKEAIEVLNNSALKAIEEKEIYIFETTELDMEEKEHLLQNYSLTSVPSFLVLDDNKPKYLYVGIPSEDDLLRIFN